MNRHRMFAFCVCVWSSLIAVAEDWPQFRGINASGVTMSKKPLPTEFSLEKTCAGRRSSATESAVRLSRVARSSPQR